VFCAEVESAAATSSASVEPHVVRFMAAIISRRTHEKLRRIRRL
jgi:hypothetical protein